MKTFGVNFGIAAATIVTALGIVCGSDPSPTPVELAQQAMVVASPTSGLVPSPVPPSAASPPTVTPVLPPPTATLPPPEEVSTPSATPDLVETSVSMVATKDNTIYEPLIGVFGFSSNGRGSHIFAGSNNGGFIRRAFIAFDVGKQVPAEAIIVSATLNLHMSRTRGPEQVIEVHRLLRDWGEGASDASTVKETEGQGAPAQQGDATWIHRIFDTKEWEVPGGDFSGTASASASVGDVGDYTWTSEQLTADVQTWVDEPSTNFGWVLIGTEDSRKTAKRFDSKDNDNEANWPTLTITFAVQAR